MSPRDTHHQSLLKRESGEFQDSLKINIDALMKYQEEHDSLGFAEALADQTITLRHLFWKTEDQNFLVLAKHILQAAIEITVRNNNPEASAIPLFNLGKVHKELKEYSAAVDTYKKAIEVQEQTPSKHHNRPAVLADFKIHLAEAEYRNGDKTAKERLLQALNELEKTDEDSFNKNVWASGAHLYLVELLKDDAPNEARKHLQKAKEIIDSDQRLILRKNQWEKLAQEFK